MKLHMREIVNFKSFFFQQWINNGFSKNFIVISASWQAGSPPNILCALHSILMSASQLGCLHIVLRT